MVKQSLGDPPSCEFCGDVVFVGLDASFRKVKLKDGTRKEGWLCVECDPDG